MWSNIINTASDPSLDVTVHAIFNPASGPGTAVDPNYMQSDGSGSLRDLKDVGGIIYGYVATGFGVRDVSLIKGDIDKYYDQLYPGKLDGIFFDEMSNDLAKTGMYQDLRDYVKGKSSTATIVGNPGTTFTNNTSGQTIYSVLDYATSVDVMVTFENSAFEYINNYTAPSWADDLSADRFAHIIHSQSGWDDQLLTLAHQRKVGMLYVTDDVMGNPYDQPIGLLK